LIERHSFAQFDWYVLMRKERDRSTPLNHTRLPTPAKVNLNLLPFVAPELEQLSSRERHAQWTVVSRKALYPRQRAVSEQLNQAGITLLLHPCRIGQVTEHPRKAVAPQEATVSPPSTDDCSLFFDEPCFYDSAANTKCQTAERIRR
jgi:hypothetical protein